MVEELYILEEDWNFKTDLHPTPYIPNAMYDF